MYLVREVRKYTFQEETTSRWPSNIKTYLMSCLRVKLDRFFFRVSSRNIRVDLFPFQMSCKTRVHLADGVHHVEEHQTPSRADISLGWKTPVYASVEAVDRKGSALTAHLHGHQNRDDSP